MNLFRSEEHARRWSGFDPASGEGIRPAGLLHAALFSRLGRFRERLAPDYLLRLPELSSGMGEAVAEVGAGSGFWNPAR